MNKTLVRRIEVYSNGKYLFTFDILPENLDFSLKFLFDNVSFCSVHIGSELISDLDDLKIIGKDEDS